jgi:DNA modification methylase
LAKTSWYFKLFNSIKEVHEVDFAELELNGLFGQVMRVRNFSDILQKEPFLHFREVTRVQDYLCHELPYGEHHGFAGTREGWPDVSKLVRRLAYIKEFYAVIRDEDPNELLRQIFPTGHVGRNVHFFTEAGNLLLRFITNQYFLEKSAYISKLSRNEHEVEKNVESLFAFLSENLYRIPASATMQVGKRLEDYFTIREEPSLHLTHYMHPYKGKFHPKMARALLNYVYPEATGIVLDNFAGSGTLLVESSLMGLDSLGIEINPLSALMSQVKCDALGFDPAELKVAISEFTERVQTTLMEYQTLQEGGTLLVQSAFNSTQIKDIKESLPKRVLSSFSDGKAVDAAIVARDLVKEFEPSKFRNFLLLGVSGTISDVARRTKKDFLTALSERLEDLYLRVYLFAGLNETLGVTLGEANSRIGDTRDMLRSPRTLDNQPMPIETDSVDAIVNSPPYSTALDYIRNDLPQLTILGLVPSLDRLEKEMMGNPNLAFYPADMSKEIETRADEFVSLPDYAKQVIEQIKDAGRLKEALRTYKFFKDMRLTLKEMHRVLKPSAKAVIIIGNNHYKLNDTTEEVKNDDVITEMAKQIGFSLDRLITRELEKSMSGEIRYESIVILQKER